jgi:hypothetical protein
MREPAATIPGLEAFVATVFPGHLATIDKLINLEAGEVVGWVRFERTSADGKQRFWELLAPADVHWVTSGESTTRIAGPGAALARSEAVCLRAAEIRDEYVDELCSGRLAEVVLSVSERAIVGEWVGQQHANTYGGPGLDAAELPFLLAQPVDEIELAIKDLVNQNQLELSSEGRLLPPVSPDHPTAAVGF